MNELPISESNLMPINVSCGSCGQKFAAKDELAGKKVRCPKCSNPLVIPAPRAAAPQPAQDGMGDLFDEAGIEATPTGGMRCPNCFSTMAHGAVMCISCGFNVQTGEKTDGFEVPDFENKNPIFKQADNELKHDAKERRKAQDPIDWYWYVAALLLIGLNAAMFASIWYEVLDAKGPANMKSDYIFKWFFLLFVAEVPFFTLFLGHWAITMWAFREDTAAQGLMCLFIPLYDMIYGFQRWKTRAMRIPLILCCVGIVWGIVVLIMFYGTGDLEIPDLGLESGNLTDK